MSDNAAQDAIKAQIDANDVMLFMKGTPQFPQCGFSSAVVQILTYVGAEFGSTNVLEDDDVRQGIKDFSDWPTIPQLYVKGEFVGGCDIVKDMFEKGELRPFLEQKGVTLAA
ncbi:MAG: Grx4 family monothiol glutaredoxin [Parvularculaceae bacterium]